MSRSENSKRNLYYALIGQFFGLLISFVARIFFVKFLSNEYLGLNGLFSNILTILSLTELGIGEAITFGLYKPLSCNDEKKCAQLMSLYKKIYIITGIIIIFLGLLIVPFLDFFISNRPNINNLELIFMLFVINSAVSYFFSYKRNLIIADQKKYIATFYRYMLYFILNVFQIIFLAITRNYIIYLLLQVITTILENLLVSIKADKMYPFLKVKKNDKLDDNLKKEVFRNSKAMFMHKIGGVVVSSTDNILLSKMISLAVVGIYSNYCLIISALNSLFSQFYNSIVASVGNLFAITNEKKQLEVFEKVDFLGFWIYSFSSACLVSLFNPFINIWLGKDYVFNFKIVVVLVLNYYLTGMRKSNLTFREASGLFYIDRWKAIIEALVNIVFSILLAKLYGTIGIFIGTTISSIFVSVWVEPFVLFKYGFKISPILYFKKYIKHFIISFLIVIVTYMFSNLIIGNSILCVLLKALVVIIISNVLFILINFKDKNFNYYYVMIKNKYIKG